MLSRLEWIPPPPPPQAPPTSNDRWLAGVTIAAGVCLAIVGLIACLL